MGRDGGSGAGGEGGQKEREEEGLPEDASVQASLRAPDLEAHPYQVLPCSVLV